MDIYLRRTLSVGPKGVRLRRMTVTNNFLQVNHDTYLRLWDLQDKIKGITIVITDTKISPFLVDSNPLSNSS